MISKELCGEGIIRTSISCTECGKTFIGKLNFDVSGNHIIVCPYCGHEHCRVILDGKIMDERWDSRYGSVKTESVWKHDSLPIETSTAAQFIRNKWLRNK